MHEHVTRVCVPHGGSSVCIERRGVCYCTRVDAAENAETPAQTTYIHVETHFATRRQTHDKGETAKCLVSNGVWPRQSRPTGSVQSI